MRLNKRLSDKNLYLYEVGIIDNINIYENQSLKNILNIVYNSEILSEWRFVEFVVEFMSRSKVDHQ